MTSVSCCFEIRYTELTEDGIARNLLNKEQLTREDIATVEAKAGSVLIFPGTTPHRSLNSLSKAIR